MRTKQKPVISSIKDINNYASCKNNADPLFDRKLKRLLQAYQQDIREPCPTEKLEKMISEYTKKIEDALGRIEGRI